MGQRKLYDIAIEMLETTTPYHGPISELSYSYQELRGWNHVSFQEILREKLQGKKRSVRRNGALEQDFQTCYEAIQKTMIQYMEEYHPQSYAYLQFVKKQFLDWLMRIAKEYGISNPEEPNELKSAPADTVIALTKELHSRKGRTVTEISDSLHLKARAIQKDLKKLDAGNAEDAEKQPPFYIGGQPVKLEISTLPAEKGKAVRYRTVNTMHPLVLLENQMQIGVLLQSLAHSYEDYDSDVSYSIGLDIWCQLSDYAKERVKLYFAENDAALSRFIDILERTKPDSIFTRFQTERVMFEDIGSIEELTILAMKGEGRRCDISLRNVKQELIGQKLECFYDVDDQRMFRAIGVDGKVTEFSFEDIEDIVIE